MKHGRCGRRGKKYVRWMEEDWRCKGTWIGEMRNIATENASIPWNTRTRSRNILSMARSIRSISILLLIIARDYLTRDVINGKKLLLDKYVFSIFPWTLESRVSRDITKFQISRFALWHLFDWCENWSEFQTWWLSWRVERHARKNEIFIDCIWLIKN